MDHYAVTITLLAAGFLGTSCATAERAAPIFLSDANIVSIMNSSDRSNIEGGRLAEEHGTSPEVQAFGRQMVADHTVMLDKNKILSERFTIELSGRDCRGQNDRQRHKYGPMIQPFCPHETTMQGWHVLIPVGWVPVPRRIPISWST